MARGLEAEAQAFGELAMTDVSRRLVEVFFATTELKKDDGVPAGYGRARPVRRLGVVGAGFMGAGIAGTAVSQAGVEVRLKDADLAKVGPRTQGRDRHSHRASSRGAGSRRTNTPASAPISPGPADFEGFGGADLVIEAVFEDLASSAR